MVKVAALAGTRGDEAERVTGRILEEHPTWVAVNLEKRGSAWLKRRRIWNVKTKGRTIRFSVEPAYLVNKLARW